MNKRWKQLAAGMLGTLSALPAVLGATASDSLVVPAPAMNVLNYIFIDASKYTQGGSFYLLIKFLIFVLVFAVIYLGVTKVLLSAHDPDKKKNKNLAVAITLVLSLLGTILIPESFLFMITQTYSAFVGIAVAIVPAVAAMAIAHLVFGKDFVKDADSERFAYIMRGILYMVMAWIYGTLLATLAQEVNSGQDIYYSFYAWGSWGMVACVVFGIISFFMAFFAGPHNVSARTGTPVPPGAPGTPPAAVTPESPAQGAAAPQAPPTPPASATTQAPTAPTRGATPVTQAPAQLASAKDDADRKNLLKNRRGPIFIQDIAETYITQKRVAQWFTESLLLISRTLEDVKTTIERNNNTLPPGMTNVVFEKVTELKKQISVTKAGIAERIAFLVSMSPEQDFGMRNQITTKAMRRAVQLLARTITWYDAIDQSLTMIEQSRGRINSAQDIALLAKDIAPHTGSGSQWAEILEKRIKPEIIVIEKNLNMRIITE